MRYILFSILLLAGSSSLKAQTSTYSLQEEEMAITALFDSLKTARDDESRKAINAKIITWWEDVLQDEESFNYNYSIIDKVGILKSADEKVRIYNWNVLYEGRKPVYYAFIQYKNSKKDEIQVWFLQDRSDEMKDADLKTLGHEDWYGCLYIDIIPTKYKDEMHYTLLGWDGNNALVNRKMIDILWFSPSGKPRFGKSIFRLEDPETGSKRSKKLKRMIFEYSARASMVLKYNAEKEFIFYDHLAPIDPKYKDMRQFYAPDMSQDLLRFKKGFWVLESNADLRRNPPKKDNKGKKEPDKKDLINRPLEEF